MKLSGTEAEENRNLPADAGTEFTENMKLFVFTVFVTFLLFFLYEYGIVKDGAVFYPIRFGRWLALLVTLAEIPFLVRSWKRKKNT